MFKRKSAGFNSIRIALWMHAGESGGSFSMSGPLVERDWTGPQLRLVGNHEEGVPTLAYACVQLARVDNTGRIIRGEAAEVRVEVEFDDEGVCGITVLGVHVACRLVQNPRGGETIESGKTVPQYSLVLQGQLPVAEITKVLAEDLAAKRTRKWKTTTPAVTGRVNYTDEATADVAGGETDEESPF